MAGFKYILGTNTFTVGTETHSYPTRTYLEFKTGKLDSIQDSHDPLIIIKNELGYTRSSSDTATATETEIETETDTDKKWNSVKDLCCDKIHIVYDDFNQNEPTQPYKRYKTTYYAKPAPCTKFEEVPPDDPAADPADITAAEATPKCLEGTYSVYKTFESWIQVLGDDTGEWRSDCNECYVEQKVRDHVVDMEFIPFDIEGRKINPLEATPENELEDNRQKIYDIRAVDVRLTFRSKKEFFKTLPRVGNPRLVKGISDRTKSFLDKYLRDSVVVTIHTRNIGSAI